MVSDDQVLASIKSIIDNAKTQYKTDVSITQRNSIPDTKLIPIENQNNWLKIPKVISIFVDMRGSTKLSASSYDKSTARIYQLFTGTAVKIFNEFNSPYVDVRGDGVLALFNGNQVHRALAVAVTFHTFCREEFVSLVKKTGLDIGSHIGIDMRTVLVRKIGIKRHQGRSDRQNEVWAGRPVNMSSKLANEAKDNEVLVSDRFFSSLKSRYALRSCGCPDDKVIDLWSEKDLSEDDRFDFNTAYVLKSIWCKNHGANFCRELLNSDD
ncbi:adenylate/guanylate cyclase domain-containing protein [Marinicella sp. W31]|uniref:adenylate/guanylate cyclase domain-containing protein n=1 Tax=Marinicella sp. W31 TaxID=3023713 RepID=UPI003757B00A